MLVYPSTLPCPAVATIKSAERRLLSPDGKGPRLERTVQRDRLAIQQIVLPPLSPEDSATFDAWWRDDLILGGAWFSATWPLPQGLITAVRRFIGAPNWQFISAKPGGDAGGYWRVSATCEVRGRGQVPEEEEPCLEGPIWTLTAMASTATWTNIIWDDFNRRFIGTGILAGEGVAGYSANLGQTWADSVSNPLAFSGGGVGFKYKGTANNGAGLTVGFGDGAIIGHTSNGTTWTQPSTAIFGKDTLAFANGVFLAMNGTSTDIVFTSTDGLAWTSRLFPSAQAWIDAAYDPVTGRWVAINATSRETAFSLDLGATWTVGGLLPIGFAADLPWRIAFGAGVFVAIPSTNFPFFTYTLDGGVTWLTASVPALPSTTIWNDIYFANLVWMAISTSAAAGISLIAISTDGFSDWAAAVNQLPIVPDVNWLVSDDGNGNYAALGDGSGTAAAWGRC